jgi:CheY-like chemotaxis protein
MGGGKITLHFCRLQNDLKLATINAMSIHSGPILIVEDMPNVQELLAVTLRFKGYPVVTANNGQEALDAIEKERPAMIITDILMPRMDGYSLVHRLRNDPKTRDIPVVFLSATYVTPEDKAFALSLGAAKFLEKPVDTEEFLLTIAEILLSGPVTGPVPMPDESFYRGYRERLEIKLVHKNSQITRTERLLQTLPSEQRASFEALLKEERSHRDDIQVELDQLHRILAELEKKR